MTTLPAALSRAIAILSSHPAVVRRAGFGRALAMLLVLFGPLSGFAQNLPGVGRAKEKAPTTAEAITVPKPAKIAALFVANHADPKYAAAGKQLEDILSAQVAGEGYSIITREIALDSIKSSELDERLSHDASMLALARSLRANLILLVTITSIAADVKEFHSGDVSTTNYVHSVLATYKVADVARGATVAGDAVKASFTRRATANSSSTADWMPEVMEQIAAKMVAGIKASESRVLPAAQAAEVGFSIATSMATDPAAGPMSVPMVEKEGGVWLVKSGRLDIQVLDVTVELDGMVLGSAPDRFKAAPGLHKLKLTRDGFVTWERTINIFEGQTLRVPMSMSAAGLARWKALVQFAAELKTDEKLTDAKVKVLEGGAQMLRQSGFKVDTTGMKSLNAWSLF